MAYVGRQPLAGEVILMNSIESQFNGTSTTFNLTRTVSGTTLSFFPVSSEHLFVSLGGVIQQPDKTGNIGFRINYDQIIFAVAPPAGTKCFIIAYGNILDIGTPADGTVTPDKLSTGGPWWLTNGNFGVGTTNPQSKFQIEGETRFSGQSFDQYIYKSIGTFSSANGINYMLVCPTTQTNARLIGRIIGSRNTNSLAVGAGLYDVVFTTNTGAIPCYSIETLSTEDPTYGPVGPTWVTLDYDGTSYYALEFTGNRYANDMDHCTISGIVTNVSLSVINSALVTVTNVTPLQTGGNKIFNNVNVGIDTLNPQYKLEVNGSFAATTKSFLIPHPTKENYKLRHGSLEGPENGVYVRGRTSTNIIELPDYWTGLVDADSITVNLTPIGNRHIWVEEINNNKVYINSEDTIDCFYTVFAERKDVEKLIVEIEEN